MAYPHEQYPSWSCAWDSTPRSRQKWKQLQLNTATLMSYDQPWTCYICNKQNLRFYHWTESPRRDEDRHDQATIDHVIPRSRGGSNTRENMRPCCYPCNIRKGNKMPSNANLEVSTNEVDFGICSACNVYTRNFSKRQLRCKTEPRCKSCVRYGRTPIKNH